MREGLSLYTYSSFFYRDSDISNSATDKQRPGRRRLGWPAGHFLGIACLLPSRGSIRKSELLIRKFQQE
jgi:hypothetical protein